MLASRDLVYWRVNKRDYRIVLDRKSNRDTEFVVYLGGGDTPLLLREDGETPFPHSTYWSGPKYQDGKGYWSWSVREEWERVIIPAGELGLTFTVDTTSLENDLYDYYWDRALAVMFIYVYKEHYAYTDEDRIKALLLSDARRAGTTIVVEELSQRR